MYFPEKFSQKDLYEAFKNTQQWESTTDEFTFQHGKIQITAKRLDADEEDYNSILDLTFTEPWLSVGEEFNLTSSEFTMNRIISSVEKTRVYLGSIYWPYNDEINLLNFKRVLNDTIGPDSDLLLKCVSNVLYTKYYSLGIVQYKTQGKGILMDEMGKIVWKPKSTVQSLNQYFTKNRRLNQRAGGQVSLEPIENFWTPYYEVSRHDRLQARDNILFETLPKWMQDAL